MPCLTRSGLLGLQDLPIEKVILNDAGDFVYVKALTASQRDEWENYGSQVRETNGNPKDISGLIAAMVCLATVDENGNRIFTDADIPEIQKKSARVVGKIFDAAKRLSGIGADDERAILKNSGATPGEGSPSA